jgi:WhiB family redox-sensing transcriptional regulator
VVGPMSITSKEFLQRQGAAGLDWQDYAACRDVDPDLFFPLGTVGASLPQIEQAKRVCRMCPVSGPCLRWALDHGDAGVWGGTTEEERRRRRQSPALGESGRARRIRAAFLNSPVQLPLFFSHSISISVSPSPCAQKNLHIRVRRKARRQHGYR